MSAFSVAADKLIERAGNLELYGTDWGKKFDHGRTKACADTAAWICQQILKAPGVLIENIAARGESRFGAVAIECSHGYGQDGS